MTDIAVEAKGLGKLYKTYPQPTDRLLEWLSRGGKKRHREKWAIQDITFDIPRGSALGVVGANGAGKSTLLKILSGVTQPTTGSFSVNGRLSSLLELGTGFHMKFTGRDNIYMNATVLGMTKKQVDARFDEIAEFADLGKFLDQPLRTYSSGMRMRLAFSVAMLADPEILILDEVLAVGDQNFQQKCMKRINEIRQSGTTLLFVSHSVYHVRQLCDRAIWIHDGRVVMSGTSTVITDEYSNYYFAQAAGRDARRAATGHAVVAQLPHLTDVRVCPAGTDDARTEFNAGDVVDIRLGFLNPGGEGKFHLGVILNRNDEVQVFTSRSFEAGVTFEGDGGYGVIRVPLNVSGGEFYLSGFLLDETCDHVLDQRQAWTRFKVHYEGEALGVTLVDCSWNTPQESV